MKQIEKKALLWMLVLSMLLIGTAGCRKDAKDTQQDPAAEADQPARWHDNGIDGIGVVRGNSNGNLYERNKGRAVCDGKDIYYVDQESDPVRICRYNLSTEETQVLIELEDVNYCLDICFLNLIGTDLYYVDKSFDGDINRIYRLSTEDLSVQKIGDYSWIRFFLVAYDRLFVAEREGTTIYDLDGIEIKRIDGFIVCGAMDGVLYGEDRESNCCVSLDLEGNLVDRYESIRNPIPINGYLVELNNYFGEHDEYINEITVINVSNQESTVFEVTQIGCSNYYNVSGNWIYLQNYGLDEMGEIYRIDWNGNGFSIVDDHVFMQGFALWEDTILADYVPCDSYNPPWSEWGD